MSIRGGWRRLRGITGLPSNGQSRSCARRITRDPPCAAWNAPIGMVLTSFLKSMEQGQTFRSTVPQFATDDPNYRILARRRSRFTHYYFYIRDETLGPMGMRVASSFPFQARDRARRQTLRPPADRQGNQGRSHLCAPTHQPASSQQKARSRLLQSRRIYPQYRSTT